MTFTTSDEVKSYLDEVTEVNDITVDLISPPDHVRSPTYACFKVRVPWDSKDKLLHEDLWPCNCVVTEYWARSRTQQDNKQNND